MTAERARPSHRRILVIICGALAWLCGASTAPAADKVGPESLFDHKFKLVLNLGRIRTLRSRDVKYSFFPGGRHCAFTYTGPKKPATIARLTAMGLKTTVYVPPNVSAKAVKAFEDAGAEVGVSGYWGAIGGYASLIAGNSVQEAFDAIATSRLAVRGVVRRPVLPCGTCGGHCSTFSFPLNRNMDYSGGYGAVFQDSNFLSLGFASQGCLSILLGRAGNDKVAVRSINRNTMRSNKVPNELIYYQLLAGQFEGAVRQAVEGQVVQFSLRDFKESDMKLLEENIARYGKHPAIWHTTDAMLASLEYTKKNVHILDIKKAGSKRYEITLGVEKDVFAPYLIVPLSIQLPPRFPVESAEFEGRPCEINVVERGKVPHVVVPIDAWLARGCAMSLEQSMSDMTIPDQMGVTLSITNKLTKPITDAQLTWIGDATLAGPAGRLGLIVTSKETGPFTLAPGATKKIAATATTVRGARFGIIPVSALVTGKVDGRTRLFLGGFEITVMPMMRAEMSPQMRMPLPKGEFQYFEIRLANGKARDKFISHKAGPFKGVLTLDLPEGMTAEPREIPLDFGEDDAKAFLFKVTNNAWAKEPGKVRPVIRPAGSTEALELLDPGTTVIRDRKQIDHSPLDDTGLLVYAGWNDTTKNAAFTRSAGRAGAYHYPHTKAAYAPGGVKGMCLESQPNCSIHSTYKNIDYRQGTILFWFKRDPRVRNENRYIADPATSWKQGGRSNYGEGMVFVSGVQRDGYSSGGINIRRYPTWGDKTGYIEVSYKCLMNRKYYVQAPYPRSMENKWCHVAVTWDIKKRLLELFINGKSMGKAKPGDEPWRGVPWDNAADWGHPLIVSTMDHGHWSGTMRDEFYIYNRPLLPEEIQANMKAAKAGN